MAAPDSPLFLTVFFMLFVIFKNDGNDYGVMHAMSDIEFRGVTFFTTTVGIDLECLNRFSVTTCSANQTSRFVHEMVGVYGSYVSFQCDSLR